MVDPIYETTASHNEGITNPTYPDDVENSVTGYRGGDGMKVRHITVDDAMDAKAAPKNLPATWSSGPDNNDYLAKD